VKRLVCLVEATKGPVAEMRPGYGDGSGWVGLQMESRYLACLQLSLLIPCVSGARVAAHYCCSKALFERLTRVFQTYAVS